MSLMILGGGLIISVLSAVAIYYHVLLHRQKKQREQSEKDLERFVGERREQNLKSIIIIANAILEDQVTHTEASIRINALLPSLSLEKATEDQLSVFAQLADATQHIPILERWKALSRKEKAAFDKERESIEAKFSEFVVVAAKKIAHENLLSR